MHTLVLIDDLSMIRRGFAAYFSGTGCFSIVGEAGSLQGAYALFDTLITPPELALLNIELGADNGLDLIAYLKRQYPRGRGDPAVPRPAVVAYSIHEDPLRVQAAINAGVRGYLSKSVKEEEVVIALEAVLRKKIYIEEKLLKGGSPDSALYNGLTGQERKILALVQKNYDNRRISRELDLGQGTVENYMTRIYTKTGAANRGDLIWL